MNENDIFEDDEIKHPFDPSQIKISVKPSTVDSLVKRIEHDEILLNPDFQRSDEVWDDGARSRLIESFLVRIPIPPFYMDGIDEDKWEVIDGLQRLTTIKRFVIEKTFKLSDLEYLKELNGSSYDDLPRKFQRRIDETEVAIIAIQEGTPLNVKYNIFKRINTGGIPLEPQEIRHALYGKVSSPFLFSIADSKEFEFYQPSKDNKRMLRNEYVLRVVSYYVMPVDDIASENLDTTLIETMKILNKTNLERREKLKKKFYSSLKTCVDIFGDFSFRKTNNSDRKNPQNLPLYESWMAVIGNCDKKTIQKLINNNAELIVKFNDLLDDSKFNYAISSRKEYGIKYRLKRLNEIVNEVSA